VFKYFDYEVLFVMKIAIVAAIALMRVTSAPAMDFNTSGNTIAATGAIVAGDTAKFQKAVDDLGAGGHFDELQLLLHSPGGLASEAFKMSRIIAALPFRAVIADGAICASACAQILYISAPQHEVLPGGRLGIHLCRNGTSGLADNECNSQIAKNAGTASVAIMMAARSAGTTGVVWLDADRARCWGLVKGGSGVVPSNGCILGVLPASPPQTRPQPNPHPQLP
jgi:membrane-bound ClpP family serine protease